MSQNTIMGVEEIEAIYREYCKQTNIKFSKNDFAKFLKFLQIDFYDWVKGNLRYFKNV